jgi:diguanylate cyclase
MTCRVWRAYVVIGLVMLGAFSFAPTGLAQDVIYEIVGLSCVAAIGIGLHRNRPARRWPWRLMLTGQLSWAVGDAIDSYNQDIAHVSTYPSLADAFYLAAYPVLAVGLLLLIRGRRPRRDSAGLLDSAILTAGLGVLSWVLLARPTIDASAHSVAAASVGVAYPIADILLVGLLIRLVTTPGGRTPAFRLLLGAVLLLVAGDTTEAALSLWSSSTSNAYDVVWLASYVLWGAAALHPSMETLSEPTVDDDLRFSRTRLVALALASLIAPATLVVEYLAHARIDIWAIVAGSVVLFLLVVGRMNVAISQIVSANQDRERLQTNLAYQARHDSLTDLPNRAHAMSEIGAALNRAQRSGSLLGLLFVDLDGFKIVNDTLGHAAGDVVLQEITVRLRAEVRAGDMVARLGGDEFVVLLEGLDTEADALQIADRLVVAASVPIDVDGVRTASVGASVGLAVNLDGSLDAGRLLHEADTAVYRAKRAGRGRVEVFDDALRRELSEKGELESALRQAIATDELVVHYQPIVSTGSGEVTGYEALVRWDRPGFGLLAPAEFVPMAEASMLICELDAWVLRTATAQLATLVSRDGRPMTVAVNISGRHLSTPRIVDDVRAALTRSRLPANRLVLEITETALVDDILAIHHLEQLRELGVAISIDDFGTGYNSVARLQNLPVDVIKIDRSYLDTSRRSTQVLLELLVRAAHAFDLPVIVEGVEEPEQLEVLRGLDCELAQGFYLSRPLTLEQLSRPVGVFSSSPS